MKIGTVNAGFASKGVRLGNYEFHENRYSKRRVAGKGVKEILPEFSTFLMRSVNNPEQ